MESIFSVKPKSSRGWFNHGGAWWAQCSRIYSTQQCSERCCLYTDPVPTLTCFSCLPVCGLHLFQLRPVWLHLGGVYFYLISSRGLSRVIYHVMCFQNVLLCRNSRTSHRGEINHQTVLSSPFAVSHVSVRTEHIHTHMTTSAGSQLWAVLTTRHEIGPNNVAKTGTSDFF